MRSSDKEKLLDELLRDPNYDAFRAEVYELSLNEFRAKERHPFAVYLGLAASIVILGLLLALWQGRSTETVTARPPASVASTAAVQPDQFPAIPLVETTALEMTEVIRSVPDHRLLVRSPERPEDAIRFVFSDPATVSRVNDEQFIALFPKDSVGIFQTAGGRKFVLFANVKR